MAVEESKRTLSAFIRDYIEERTPDPETATQMMAESVPALIDWLIEAVKELKDLSEFPETVQKAIKTVLEFSEAIKNGSATQSQLSTVIDSLHLLVDYDNNDLRVLMRMSDKCVNWIKAYGVSLESAKYTLRTIKKASIKMTKMLTVLNAVDIGFDTFMYMVADYSVNIEILLLLRAQMEKSYDPDDYELRAINEMISEYEDKYQTAVKNLLGRILAEGTIAFAQKAPGFGLILQVAKWGASASSSPAKADLISFLMITSAAGGLLNDPYNLYNYGTITAEFEMMKKRVSVYLSMVLYANNLAVQVKDKDYPNTDQYRTYNSNMIYKFSEYIYAPVNF